MSSYENRVWRDVLDIDTAHILLGKPWRRFQKIQQPETCTRHAQAQSVDRR